MLTVTVATNIRRDKLAVNKPQEKTCWQCGQTFSGGEDVCPNDGTRLIALTLAADHDPLLGQTIDGRYTLEERLGEGGMGTVYLATQLDPKRSVAIKVLKADYLRDENIRRRFMHEARIVANLEHPNAVQLFDFGQMSDGNFYMVMELLRGESLADRLAYKFLSYREIFEIIPPICEVLHEAHQKGVVHRDLKPENIYIRIEEDGSETPKLIDFGVAKQLESKTFTRTGTLWGTPAYMSPEQARGDEIGAAADVYAIGIIVYELICGNLPFHASTQMGYALKHMNEAPRSMLSLPGMNSVPTQLDELVLRTLSKSAAERPDSMMSFVKALEAIRVECFNDARMTRVPAEEVDPVALQDWMRNDAGPDTSSELFPLDVSAKPQRPSTPSTSAPQLVSAFSALDQLEDSIDLPRAELTEAPSSTPPPSPRRLYLGVGAALGVVLVIGAVILATQGGAPPDEPLNPPDTLAASATLPDTAEPQEPTPASTHPSYLHQDDFSPPPTTDQSVEAMGVGAMRAADVVVRARILTGDQFAEPAEVLKNSKRPQRRWRPSSQSSNEDARPTSSSPTSNSKIKKTLQKIF